MESDETKLQRELRQSHQDQDKISEKSSVAKGIRYGFSAEGQARKGFARNGYRDTRMAGLYYVRVLSYIIILQS